ncbi:UNVERIFIED_CONTAM: hypothetical protein HDU68_003037 [Siphonaria sp. JEL0065]|nr:hypothetical protein HDU68_003037 [Siphonaria sp. JEL0065]
MLPEFKSNITKVIQDGHLLAKEKLLQFDEEKREIEVKRLEYLKALYQKFPKGMPDPAKANNKELPTESIILDYLLYLEVEMKSAKVAPVATDLEELLAPCIENVYSTYKNLGIKFRHEFNTFYDWICVDPVRIEQVVLNALVGPIKHLEPSNSVFSMITIKSCTGTSAEDNDSGLSYYLEFIMHVCGIINVSSFKAKLEHLLDPFKKRPSLPDTPAQPPTTPKLELQTRQTKMSFSQETLATSMESTLSKEEDASPLALDSQPTTLSLAIAHGLTDLMNGNADLLTGHQRVSLHFKIPVEICSTASVIASSRNERRPRRRVGSATVSGHSLPQSAYNTPTSMNVVLGVFPVPEHLDDNTIRRPSILKAHQSDSSAATVSLSSRKSVRIQEDVEWNISVRSENASRIQEGVQWNVSSSEENDLDGRSSGAVDSCVVRVT